MSMLLSLLVSPAHAALTTEDAAQVYTWIFTNAYTCTATRTLTQSTFDTTCPTVSNRWSRNRCYSTLSSGCVYNAVDADGDGWDEDSDCDETNAAVNPGATETCDGVDNDCDGLVDDADASVSAPTYCRDSDRDRYGGSTCVTTCGARPRGYSSINGDCDDASASINPGVEEVCGDGVDNDCSGQIEQCWTGVYELESSAVARFDGVSGGDSAGRTSMVGDDYLGDGGADLVLASLNANGRGTVYLFPGTTTGDVSLSAATVEIYGAGTSDQMGDAVANGGDVNGDGWADLLLGAYWNEGTNTNSGAAYLVHGPITADGYVDVLADAVFENDAGGSGDQFGHAVLGDLDLNGDGWLDIVIGADLYDGGGTDAGGVFVYYGPVSGTYDRSDADHWMYGETTDAYVGHNVRPGLDTNADGYDDFTVCAPFSDLQATDAGAAYLVEGPANYTGSIGAGAAAIFEGEYSGDQAGHDAMSPGDFDGNGMDDLLVDIRYRDGNGTNAGAVTAWMSPIGGTYSMSDAYTTWNGANYNDTVGVHIATPGDMNGDDVVDFVTGAWRNDLGGADAGATYIVYGPPTAGTFTMSDASATFTGVAGDEHGFYTSGGDLNGDGLGDLITGSMYTNSNAGSFWVVYGYR